MTNTPKTIVLLSAALSSWTACLADDDGYEFDYERQAVSSPAQSFFASNVSCDSATLSWQAPRLPGRSSGDALNGYTILRRRASDDPWQLLRNVNPNVMEIADTGLQPQTTYWYKLCVSDSQNGIQCGSQDPNVPAGMKSSHAGEGPTAVITTTAAQRNGACARAIDGGGNAGRPFSPPNAPSGLVATGGDRQIHLQWNDESNNESDFRIEYRRASSFKTSKIDVGANSESYTLTRLVVDAEYSIRVCARLDAEVSGWCTDRLTASTLPLEQVEAPTNIRITVLDAHRIDVEWNDNSDDEANFTVYIVPAGPWGSAQTLTKNANATWTRVNNLLEGTNFRVSVCASAPNHNDGCSAEYDVTTDGLAPPVCTVQTVTDSAVCGTTNVTSVAQCGVASVVCWFGFCTERAKSCAVPATCDVTVCD